MPLPAPGPPRTNTTRKGSEEEEEEDDVDFLEDDAQEYSGFGRRSPYWKIQLTMIDTVDEQCLPELLFFAKAGCLLHDF